MQNKTKVYLFNFVCFSPQYRIFIGNPGAGKSTLANCVARKLLFKSGVSIGQGLTFQLDIKKHDGITYIDTPGLADYKMRKEAAKEIVKALKQDGTYQVFFVISLEAGRIRPEDIVTIKLVLESTSDIQYYNLIINKLSTMTYNILVQNNAEKLKILLTELIEQIKCVNNPPTVLLLMHQSNLHDIANRFIEWDNLDEFVAKAPSVNIKPACVKDIHGDPNVLIYLLAEMNFQIEQLRSDLEKTKKKLKETEEKYDNLTRPKGEEGKKKEKVGKELNFHILLIFYFSILK